LLFITTGFIIKAEEKECLKKFGKGYDQYKKRTEQIKWLKRKKHTPNGFKE
jgi:protein-S-isoprenylcysteine O-methyltransferase Ste14